MSLSGFWMLDVSTTRANREWAGRGEGFRKVLDMGDRSNISREVSAYRKESSSDVKK